MKFLAPLVVLLLDNDELHQDDLKKRTNSSYSSKSAKCKIVSAARNRNTVTCPPNISDDLCLFFCIHPSSMNILQGL